ncbi:hypothetical protein [Argonema antarcticum]|nr:hypothetical protein [Argonema antarcticum]
MDNNKAIALPKYNCRRSAIAYSKNNSSQSLRLTSASAKGLRHIF